VSAGRVVCRVGRVLGGLGGEGCDLDKVVGEDAVSTPGPGAGDGCQFGAVPPVAALAALVAAWRRGTYVPARDTRSSFSSSRWPWARENPCCVRVFRWSG
jgi:hypothetical protein